MMVMFGEPFTIAFKQWLVQTDVVTFAIFPERYFRTDGLCYSTALHKINSQ